MTLGVSTQMHPHVFAKKGNDGRLTHHHLGSLCPVVHVSTTHTIKESRLVVHWMDGDELYQKTFRDADIRVADGAIVVNSQFVFWETPLPLLCTGCEVCRS